MTYNYILFCLEVTMKKLFKTGLIFCVAIFYIACTQELSTKKCSFCSGKIYYHKINEGIFSSRHQMSYEEDNGKYYHYWCYKIMKDAK